MSIHSSETVQLALAWTVAQESMSILDESSLLFRATLITASSTPELDLACWLDIRDEWSQYCSDTNLAPSWHCACSSKLKHPHFLQNRVTSKIVEVEAQCIRMHCSPQAIKLLATREQARKYIGNKLMCMSCCQFLVERSRGSRAVVLCEDCIANRKRVPSSKYLLALGLVCKACNIERVSNKQPGCLCCRCAKYNCACCSAPANIEPLTYSIGEDRCMYCIGYETTGCYCAYCKCPLTVRDKQDGHTICAHCVRQACASICTLV